MQRRIVALIALVAVSLLALAGFGVVSLGTAQSQESRISFVLATGSTGGTYFPIGQAIAGIVSHPPGVARCDGPGVCGPAGVVASVRSSPGSIANVLDVDAGRTDAALAQSDIVAEAVAGKGDFRKWGAQNHVRMIADLFPEEVHVVAATRAHIRNISDLRGKRVALGVADSGTASTARAILAAYRIPEWRLKAVNDPPEIAAQGLDRGEIDAFFFVGGAPVDLIRGLIASGKAELVPIDGAGRKHLLAEEPGLTAETIPAEDYQGERGATDTVGVHAVLIVNAAVPADLVFGVTRSLFNPANRALLDAAHPSARLIRLDTATTTMPAPLHPGALHFYRDMGLAPHTAG
jgi:TRAP transporter TAXI family solute receptor